MVVAHELTHALDDQWFDLDAPQRDDDAAVARAALAEGSADRVEEAYLNALGPVDRSRAMAQLADGPTTVDLTKVPPQMWEGVEDLYGLGDAYVARLIRQGGSAAVDGVFARADLTTREVLHAGTDGPAAVVAVPPADGAVVDDGVLGELGLLDLLATAMAPAAAREAAAGWDGDRYVVWEKGGASCLRVDLRLEPVVAGSTRRALDRWAEAGGDRTIARSSAGVLVTSCG